MRRSRKWPPQPDPQSRGSPKTGDTSVVVKVETWARGRGHGKEPQKVTEGVFTFVALDEGGHPRSVSGDSQG